MSYDDENGELEKDVRDISFDTGRLRIISYNILCELRKTNALLSRGMPRPEKHLVFSEGHLSKNIIIECDDPGQIADYVKALEAKTGKEVRSVSDILWRKGCSSAHLEREGDAAAILTNLNDDDYLLLNAEALQLEWAGRMFYSAISENGIDVVLGKRSIYLDLKKIHYIIHTDLIEMVDPRIRKAVDMII